MGSAAIPVGPNPSLPLPAQQPTTATTTLIPGLLTFNGPNGFNFSSLDMGAYVSSGTTMCIGTRFSSNAEIKLGAAAIGFFNTNPIAKPTVAGSRGGNAALLSLLTCLANLGLVIDTTTA